MPELSKIHLMKQNDQLPDNYAMTVFYFDGTQEEYEIAQHTFVTKFLKSKMVPTDEKGNLKIVEYREEAQNQLEFVTKEDEWLLIPVANIKKLKFDKRFSKIVSIRNEEVQKVKGGES